MTKIASLEAIPVSYPEPNDFGSVRHLCLLRVETDDGHVGWGESITQWPEASWATKAIIDGLAELVVGTSPVHNATTLRLLREHVWWYGYGGGIASNAISAVDIALWDLKGHVLGCSVLDLLGGPVHDRLPAIASGHAFKSDLDEMADDVAGWLRTGLHGVKMGFGKKGHAHLGYEHARDVEFVRLVREAAGDAASIMVDLGYAIRWDVATAVRRTRAFEDYGIAWIEEPLGAWDPAGYGELKSKVSTSIAYGEREWTVSGYARVLDTDTVDVVGIDPGRAEGISGFREVCALVERHRRQANAHAWSSAIVTAASLAGSFSSRACRLIEVKPLPNPMQDDLVAVPIRHREGWFDPPQGPGLGIEVKADVVDAYRAVRP